MTDNLLDTIALPNLVAIKEKVNREFEGFIGNGDAVYAIKRSLVISLSEASDGGTVSMPRTFLFSGPASVGKSHLARLVTRVIDLPFVRIDGRAVKSRENLFSMIDDALLAQKPPLHAEADGEESGMPKMVYPSFLVFIDEGHLMSERMQEALLTLLEADDRTMLLNGERGRRIAVVRQASWIFATTKPADLNKAFRSRCSEIKLRKYSVEEVQVMVRQRFTQLPDQVIEIIASCSRCIPRVAFDIARDVIEEIKWSDHGIPSKCVKSVMNGRGVYFFNGITLDDLRYLLVLQHERRSMGEGVLKAQLYDIDPLRITDDIEPFLLGLGYIIVTGKGRQLTAAGERFLADAGKSDNLDPSIMRLIKGQEG